MFKVIEYFQHPCSFVYWLQFKYKPLLVYILTNYYGNKPYLIHQRRQKHRNSASVEVGLLVMWKNFSKVRKTNGKPLYDGIIKTRFIFPL